MIAGFDRMRDERDLAAYLACSEDLIEHLHSSSSTDLFVKHEIPKRGKPGRFREAWELVDRAIADVYKNLARALDTFFRARLNGYPHPAAHGYITGRSIRTNAQQHLGAPCVLKADIKLFFQSIDGEMVKNPLLAAGMNDAAATALASLLVWEGHLPLGLHTSPVLANAVCTPLDVALSALMPGGMYTRYADDLSFSGPQLPSKEAVSTILLTHRFRLAEEKWRVVRRGRGLFVTGLSLEDRTAPRVPRATKRRLRQEIHFVERFGLEEHAARCAYGSANEALNAIHGTIQFVRGIERSRGDALHSAWSSALTRQGFDASLVAPMFRRGNDALMLVDESVVDDPGTLALCLVVVEDAERIRGSLEDFTQNRTAQPYAANVDRLESGLHWNGLNHDDRTKVVEHLIGLTFKVFVAYAALPSKEKADYVQLYLRLLERLIEGRFVKFAGASVVLKVEQNNKIKPSDVEAVTSSVYEQLAKRGSRRPLSVPACEIASKGSDPALPLPDLVLGVVTEYLWPRQGRDVQATPTRYPGEQAQRRYLQLLGKIKAIYDVDGGRVFSRKNPFIQPNRKP
jgi:RNA-directed DNA polymerase